MADKNHRCWPLFLDIIGYLPRNDYKRIAELTEYCPFCGVHAPWANDCVVIDE